MEERPLPEPRAAPAADPPSNLRTLKLTIAYDGAAYSGWQIQPGVRTIQQTLQDAIAAITGAPTAVVASGRTDAGVHAQGQVVSFRTKNRLPADVLKRALNATLPHDIRVLTSVEASPGFHALRDTIGKRYRYVLNDGETADVFRRHYAWHYRERLNAEAMHAAAQQLIGKHDFSSFETSGAPRATSVRTVYELSVRRQSPTLPDEIHLEIEANGFLYNMVRTIVGSLVEIGRGARSAEWLAEVRDARARSRAGGTAPARGLVLLSVDYAE